MPDVIAVKDGRTYALELKAEGGRLTEAQEHVLIKLRAAGAMATHAHGLDQALRILEGWGIFAERVMSATPVLRVLPRLAAKACGAHSPQNEGQVKCKTGNQKPKNLPAGPETELDNIRRAAEADAGFEKRLKFKKGKYFIGDDEVALGSQYIAHARQWT